MGKGKTIGVTVDETGVARVDRLAAEMTKRAAGALVAPSTAARVAMLRGLDVLEAELGLVTAPPVPKGGRPARKPAK